MTLGLSPLKYVWFTKVEAWMVRFPSQWAKHLWMLRLAFSEALTIDGVDRS